MKNAKKIVGLLLALAMILVMAIPVLAVQEGNLDGGSITINDAVPEQSYNAYQILYLESYNSDPDNDPKTDDGIYVYKANSVWETWLSTQTSFVKVDDQGYVTWVGGADAAEFAEKARAEVKGSTISADKTATAPAAEGNGKYSTVTFENLKLGYYLIDTTLGTLCSLDTTNPEAVMYEKNEEPTVDKKVKEGNNWGPSNDASIGDTVEFMTTIHAKKGAAGYVLHDTMSEGLTLDETSIKVAIGETTAEEDKDYIVTVNPTDKHTFDIEFKPEYLESITVDMADIVVAYKAVLNKDAEIHNTSNSNKTYLDYGSKSHTEEVTTDTYTFKFELVKTDENNKLLTGAKFKLYDAEKDGNEIALVKEGSDYRVATAEERATVGFTGAEIEAGRAVVKGLDTGTYWLEEIAAPDRYNKLADRVEVKINKANLEAVVDVDRSTWIEGGVHVVNRTGSLLPSTGGMGTTIFYVLGGILAVGALVLLVTRKRMDSEK